MALIKCEECGKEISNKAKACVHCGCPIISDGNISIDNSNNADKTSIRQNTNEYFDKNSRKLSVEFNAVVSTKSKESTINTIYVKELNKNIEVLVPNNIKVNEKIFKKIDNDSKCELIVFTVKNVSIDSNIKSVTLDKKSKKKLNENKTANDFIKNYNPNCLVRFFDGPGVKKVSITLIGFSLIYYFKEGDFLVVIICAILTLPLLLIRMVYPFLKLIKYIKKNKIDDAIKNDPDCLNIAIRTYNLLPSRRMLWYIKKLNIDAGLEIERQIRKK